MVIEAVEKKSLIMATLPELEMEEQKTGEAWEGGEAGGSGEGAGIKLDGRE